MSDYDTLLDDEMKAYLARCDALYPPNAVDLDIAGQRRVYDDMCADFDRGRPPNVKTWDADYGGVPCRRYEVEPSAATVMYCHGGGFVVGGLDSHDSICAEICAQTGLRVVSIDYPLAPEHTYPDDFNAAWRAYLAIAQDWSGPIVLAGDSAGGNLAAAIAHKARSIAKRPVGVMLIYPGLGGDITWPSYIDHANAPQLTLKDLEFYKTLRPGGPQPEGDPFYAPLQDTDFSDLPPIICVSAQCDPLTSDCDHYVRRILAAGGQAQWIDMSGMVHGFLRARIMSQKAAAGFDVICQGITRLSKGHI